MRRLLLLAGILFLLFGCGYQLPGRGEGAPAGVRHLHVELFANRTAEPFLEALVTDQVIREFFRLRGLQIVDTPGPAEAVLSGTITDYSSVPISYDSNDNITEYRSTMQLSAALRSAEEGRSLWKGTVAWSEEYPASLDRAVQEDSEAAAIRVISQRLAEELFYRITDDF